ncbi:hypothetical protein LRAMOSA06490 [Lichtheimia ramosa]|uniref:Uncharacterized protein n=1 Tax=Lichtheimia ramosa TaxID=688394 RepID=A0A077X3X8_9FUNG|nr:hypothetical protein LRAMOSA06490 [Lichtheimia ramosa]
MIHSAYPTDENWHWQYHNRTDDMFMAPSQPYYEYQQVPAANPLGQPMGIFPESQRRAANEEWRVGGRARESWKVALPQQQPKPLPQEPPAPPPRRSFVQHHHDPYYGYDWSAAPMAPHQVSYYTDEPMSTELDTTHELPTPDLHIDPSPPASSSSTSSGHYGPPSLPIEQQQQQQQPTEKKKTTSKPEDNIRQITVQSINKEHMVWIKIDTTETGLSLANKIHTIATFRTRKIVSITTAAGRTIPLDHRPVFGSWMDMDDFQNGEEWKVEWCELDKGLVDRLVSKFIQVSGSRRK